MPLVCTKNKPVSHLGDRFRPKSFAYGFVQASSSSLAIDKAVGALEPLRSKLKSKLSSRVRRRRYEVILRESARAITAPPSTQFAPTVSTVSYNGVLENFVNLASFLSKQNAADYGEETSKTRGIK